MSKISIDAYGAYNFLKKKFPDGKLINPAKAIQDEFKIGREKVYRIIKELINSGILVKSEKRIKGVFNGVDYTINKEL